MFQPIEFNHFPLLNHLYLSEQTHPNICKIVWAFQHYRSLPDIDYLPPGDECLHRQVTWLKVVVAFFKKIDARDLEATLVRLKKFSYKQVHIIMQIHTAPERNVVLMRATGMQVPAWVKEREYLQIIREFLKVHYDACYRELSDADAILRTLQSAHDRNQQVQNLKFQRNPSAVSSLGTQPVWDVVTNEQHVIDLMKARVYVFKLSHYRLDYDEYSSLFVLYDPPFELGSIIEGIEMPYFLTRLMNENREWEDIALPQFFADHPIMKCETGEIYTRLYRTGSSWYNFAMDISIEEVPEWFSILQRYVPHEASAVQMIGSPLQVEESDNYRIFGSLCLDRGTWPHESDNFVLSSGELSSRNRLQQLFNSSSSSLVETTPMTLIGKTVIDKPQEWYNSTAVNTSSSWLTNLDSQEEMDETEMSSMASSPIQYRGS